MFRRIALAAGVLLLPGGLAVVAPPAASTAFVDVTIISMTDSFAREHQTVVVQGETIAAVGDRTAIRVPAGAKVVDGGGRFLLPGLTDAHVHLMEEADLDQFLVWGVTTVRNLTGSPEVLAWRQAVAAGRRPGPRIVTSGPLMAGPNIPWREKVVPADAASARAEVRRQRDAGYDLIKVYDGLSPQVYAAIADEAARVGLPVTGHIPEQVHLATVLRARQNLEHTDKLVFDVWGHTFDQARIDSVATAIRRAGVFVTPTIASMEQLARIGGGGFDSLLARFEASRAGVKTVGFWCAVSSRMRGHRPAPKNGGFDPWTEFQLRVIAGERRAGVPLVAGSDYPNAVLAAGSGLIEELRALTDAGLSPLEALRAATITAARAVGDSASGYIAPGGRADLVLLSANPLAARRAVNRTDGVRAAGRWFTAAALARRAPTRTTAAGCGKS